MFEFFLLQIAIFDLSQLDISKIENIRAFLDLKEENRQLCS